MPSWPTPGDRREDHAQQAGAAVGAIYAQAELVIIAAVAALARKVASGSVVPAVAARQLKHTAAAVFDAAAPKARQVLDTAMQGAQAGARRMLAPTLQLAMPGPAQATQDLAVLLDTAVSNAEQAAAGQLQAITAATAKIGSATAKTAADAFPALPRNPYREALGNALGKFAGYPGQSLSYRRLQAAQEMLNDLAGRGITGFTDRTGRKWDLASYVEMATRTAVSNAWDDVQAGMAARSGLDLAEIATHSTEGTCPACFPWLGRTISLRGATEGYPTLAEAKADGFRHPNCRCFFVVIGAGYLPDVTNPVPLSQALAVYKHSQDQRAHERAVRAAGRLAQAAVTPQAKTESRRALASARAASAAHRQRHQLRITQTTVRRREAPFGAR